MLFGGCVFQFCSWNVMHGGVLSLHISRLLRKSVDGQRTNGPDLSSCPCVLTVNMHFFLALFKLTGCFPSPFLSDEDKFVTRRGE